MYRVITCNTNGIRAAARKGFFDWLDKQDADVVLMVHREEYYLTAQEREQMKDGSHPRNCLGEADIIISKQRNGPTGEVKLHWFQQFTRFKNAERHEYSEFESYGTESEF